MEVVTDVSGTDASCAQSCAAVGTCARAYSICVCVCVYIVAAVDFLLCTLVILGLRTRCSGVSGAKPKDSQVLQL